LKATIRLTLDVTVALPAQIATTLNMANALSTYMLKQLNVDNIKDSRDYGELFGRMLDASDQEADAWFRQRRTHHIFAEKADEYMRKKLAPVERVGASLACRNFKIRRQEANNRNGTLLNACRTPSRIACHPIAR